MSSLIHRTRALFFLAPFVFAPGFAVAATDIWRGTLRVDSYKPVQGIEVEAWLCEPIGFFCSWRLVGTATTDDRGEFETYGPSLSGRWVDWAIKISGSNDAAQFDDGAMIGLVPTSVQVSPFNGRRIINFDVEITDPTWRGRIAILQQLREAKRRVDALRDPRESDVLPLAWLTASNTTFFDAPTYTFTVDPLDVSARALYEYARFVLHHISRLGPSSVPYDPCVAANGNSRELAWTAAFAYFFVHAVGWHGWHAPEWHTLINGATCSGNAALGIDPEETPLNVGAALVDIVYNLDWVWEYEDRNVLQIVDHELDQLARDATLSDFYEAYVARGFNRTKLDRSLRGRGITPRPITPILGYDRDGRIDIAVYRPSTSEWWFINSSNGAMFAVPFGQPGDVPVPADYDGDGVADLAVWRPWDGTWHIRRTANEGFVQVVQWGTYGDIPVPADYSGWYGDGYADISVFRPSDGTWWIYTREAMSFVMAFGARGDVPVPANYDTDLHADPVVWSPSTATWSFADFYDLTRSSFVLGAAGWDGHPVPADYDCDGMTDAAYFHPFNGGWWIQLSSWGSMTIVATSARTGVVPVPGDYDGDGCAEIAYWTPSTGIWTNEGSIFWWGWSTQQWGAPDDIPVPAR